MVPRNCPYSALSRPFRALSRPFGESGHGIMTKLRSRLTRRQGVNLSHRNRGFDGWFMSIYVQFGWMILRCRVDQDEFYWVLVRVHAWWYMIHDDTWYMFIYVLAMFSYRIDGSVEMFRQSFTCQVYLEKITVWGAVKVLHTFMICRWGLCLNRTHATLLQLWTYCNIFGTSNFETERPFQDIPRAIPRNCFLPVVASPFWTVPFQHAFKANRTTAANRRSAECSCYFDRGWGRVSIAMTLVDPRWLNLSSTSLGILTWPFFRTALSHHRRHNLRHRGGSVFDTDWAVSQQPGGHHWG